MIPDPIVEEVRAVRDEIAKEFGYDINALFEAFRRLEATSSAPHVSLPARNLSEQEQRDPTLVKGAA
jgi:hypothetical protein